jgi:hypothetical protein
MVGLEGKANFGLLIIYCKGGITAAAEVEDLFVYLFGTHAPVFV